MRRTSMCLLPIVFFLLVSVTRSETLPRRLTPAGQHIQEVFRRLAYERWPRHILLLDAQATLPSQEVEAIRKATESALGVQMLSRQAEKSFRFAVDGMPGLLQSLGTNVVALVVMLEAPSGNRTPPMLITHPDAHWAVFSVGDLLARGLSPAQFRDRVLTQTMRATGFAVGAGFAVDPFDVMKPVSNTAQLDKLNRSYGAETRNAITPFFLQAGLDLGGAMRYQRLMTMGVVPPRHVSMWPDWEKRYNRKAEEVLRSLGISRGDYIRPEKRQTPNTPEGDGD